MNYGQYTVQKGDSLYSIAWRFKRDYKELARINGIKAPYTIQIGQEIRLSHLSDEIPSKNGYTGHSVIEKPKYTKAIEKSSAKNTIRTSSKSSTASKLSQQAARAKQNTQTSRIIKPSVSNSIASRSRQTNQAQPKAYTSSGTIKWQWPASGKVIQGFSRSSVGKKGIQISGNSGEPIKAVAKGKVVYSGNSLLGYGNLVIVKHNEQFLTAYAHNRRVIVKEGAVVEQGQKIAEMGSSGTDRNKLHFEIRRQGKPVNPLNYLPRR